NREKVREAMSHQTKIGLGAVSPLRSKTLSIPTFDVHGDDRSGHRVEPRGEHDRIQFKRPRYRINSFFSDGSNRISSHVHQADVRKIECLVVVRIETRTLRAIEMISWAERFGRLGLADDGADLLSQKLAHGFVRFRAQKNVGIRGAEGEKIAG